MGKKKSKVKSQRAKVKSKPERACGAASVARTRQHTESAINRAQPAAQF
jgi:hypothetical protein